MGVPGSKCCAGQTDTTQYEQKATEAKAMDLPGSNAIPAFEPQPMGKDVPAAVAATPAVTEPPAPAPAPPVAGNAPAGSGEEFEIRVDKSTGTKLGIDVDHQDGQTLLVEMVNGGLIETWNVNNPERKVCVGDRIVEVSGLRGDVLQIVDECKKNKVLVMKVRRA
eukprot:TRINITY_DN54_c1_g1_i1.p1 TRINITY_DN54_c1_g1~~TRINITY_DN54_c1_g1_i1.p1  ORF type:complete len:165 (+),score=45.17 TRINITY_DN54_c1_g1_i1:77-571(+)